MTRILLLGDSIRMGYEPFVRELLSDRAEVRAPKENCGNSFRLREHLREWAVDPAPDVIHFNAGIHDLGWMEGETVPRFTASAYARNLRIIVRRLRRDTEARLVFATTTPFLVPMGGDVPKEERRPAPVVETYNAAALRVMEKEGVAVNDLHAVIMEAGAERCLSEDCLHMNENGSRLLARAVAKAVTA